MTVSPAWAQQWKRAHMVGVGGAGMSAIARVLIEAGVFVSGSDLAETAVTQQLRALGIAVSIGHKAQRVEGASVVIASAAVPDSNPEVAAAAAAGIPVLSRGEALARIVEGRRTVAVSGTHGKTTTSGMVATVLETAGADPLRLLGADLGMRGPGGRLGSGEAAVVEADEAYGSFRWLQPDVGVVTNVDEDHLDFYGDLDALQAAFEDFARRSAQVVLCGEDERASALSKAARACLTYGLDGDFDVRAEQVSHTASGSTFRLAVRGHPMVEVHLAVAGRHNVQNALGAAAACAAFGLSVESIAAGLAAFPGAARRFEYRGSFGGADLVDDYAHHPTEIRATLQAARNGSWSRVLAVFQPHLYSRTLSLWSSFGSALAEADLVVVTDVYGAREQPVPGVTGKLVVEGVCDAAPGRRVAYLPKLDEAARFVRAQTRPGDLVLSLGAGDITTLADRLL